MTAVVVGGAGEDPVEPHADTPNSAHTTTPAVVRWRMMVVRRVIQVSVRAAQVLSTTRKVHEERMWRCGGIHVGEWFHDTRDVLLLPRCEVGNEVAAELGEHIQDGVFGVSCCFQRNSGGFIE